MIDNLYFMVVYALPSLPESQTVLAEKVKAAKAEMTLRVSPPLLTSQVNNDKINIFRSLMGSQRYLIEEEFATSLMDPKFSFLLSTKRIRERLTPVCYNTVTSIGKEEALEQFLLATQGGSGPYNQDSESQTKIRFKPRKGSY